MPTIEEYFIFQLLQRSKPGPRGARAPMNSPPFAPPPLGGPVEACAAAVWRKPQTGCEILTQVEHNPTQQNTSKIIIELQRLYQGNQF